MNSTIGPAVQEKICKFECILLKAITCAKFPWNCDSVILEKNILQFVNVFSLVANDYTCVYPFEKRSTLPLNVNKSESTQFTQEYLVIRLVEIGPVVLEETF